MNVETLHLIWMNYSLFAVTNQMNNSSIEIRFSFFYNWISWDTEIKRYNAFNRCSLINSNGNLKDSIRNYIYIIVMTIYTTWESMSNEFSFPKDCSDLSLFLFVCIMDLVIVILTFISFFDALNFHKIRLVWTACEVTYMLYKIM